MDYGTVQFHHDKENGITYALDVGFNREDLLESVHNFERAITLFIGESYVHPNDVYCKQTGREISMAKLKPVEFKLRELINNQDKIYVTLNSEDLKIELRVCKESEKPHFLNAEEDYNF